MENTSNVTADFEAMLQKSSINKSSALYKGNKSIEKLIEGTQDVIDSVNIRIKAMQVADRVKSGRLSNMNYKKNQFLTIDNLPDSTEQHTNSKFETQCVSDTQLIEIVKTAEVLSNDKRITEEFDNTFCYTTFDKGNYSYKNEMDDFKTVSNTVINNIEILNKFSAEGNKNSQAELGGLEVKSFSPDVFIENNEGCMDLQFKVDNSNEEYYTNNTEFNDKNILILIDTETNTNVIPNYCNTIDSFNDDNEINDSEVIALSPILNIRSVKQPKSLSPLVFDLETFEKFEAITLPQCIKDKDFNTTKHLVNSQILGAELHLNIKQKAQPDLHSPSLNTQSEQLGLVKLTLPFNRPMKTENIKQNNSLDDEILFSSDEEENYIYKQSQDLPFTYALETSFYGQSDILDKTMYVGFQTASNKSIQVSNESFSKAKAVFNDLDDNCGIKEHYMIDLVEKCDDVSKYCNSHNILKNVEGDCDRENKNFYRNKDKNGEVAFNNDHVLEKGNTREKLPKKILFNAVENNNLNMPPYEPNLNKVNMGGFVTASNKNIKLSEIALTRCKKVFQGIDLDDHFNTNVEGNFDNIAYKECDKYFEISNNNNEVTDLQDEMKETETIPNIDDEHILQEFQHSEMVTDNFLNKVDTSVKKNNCKDIIENKKCFAKNNYELCHETPTNDSMPNSVESISKAKTILKDLKFTDINLRSFDRTSHNKEPIIVHDHSITNTGPLNDFKFASNEQEFNFNETLMKTINIGESIKEYNANINNENVKVHGFKTASNREIKISYEALLKSKKLFEDITLGQTIDSTVNTKTDKCGRDLLKKQNKIIEIDQNDDESTPNIVGFKTASNKSVNISKQALEKSVKLFQELDQGEIFHRNDSKKDGNNSVNMRSPCFTGFQTASKKTVKISAEALAKTKKIFQDIDLNSSNKIEEDNLSLNENTSASTGFQTANNKKVTISVEALAKSKTKIDNFYKSNAQNIEKLTDLDCADHNFSNSNHNFASSFKGFQTASNKEVKISEEALAKCRQIFQDEDLTSQVDENLQALDKNRISTINTNNHLIENEILDVETNALNNLGFKTASNRKILISDDALLKSKILLDETSLMISKSSPKDVCLGIDKFEEKENLQNIVNTQVLNNFDETLYTEDFHKDLATSKRSTSPILSCPRAKKRKFETPYKNNLAPIGISKVDAVEIKNTLIFKEDYKKCKLYKLKDLKNLESNYSIMNINKTNTTFDNLLDFIFSGNRNEVTDANLHIEGLKEIFTSAVNLKLIPEGWLDNHLKLILWKLLSYESVYPNTLGVVCTARNVLNQLKYRYDKELYNAERPALRKILERDDVPSKTLILCVVDIKKNLLDDKSVASLDNKAEILVTDGWYCMKACLDKMLTELVLKNKISVGTKIVTNGAELLNCEQGISPWEDISSVRLKLCGNSTRRARWDSRLGYHCNVSIMSRLSLVRPDGGKVSKLRVLVTRVYPALYIEKLEDGNTVTRSERLEHIHEMKYESDRQALLERLYEEVEREFSDPESQDSEDTMNSRRKRKSLDSGSQLSKMMKTSAEDPTEFGNHLTESQAKLLQDRVSRRRERLLRNVQARLLEKMEKHGLCQKRNVVTLLKVRIADVEEKGDGVLVTKGMMSVWKPNESVLELVKEGDWINVMNVVPTSVRCSELHISAGRQSIFGKSKYKENDKTKPHIQTLLRTCYHMKELLHRPSLTNGYNEIDTVGIIVSIEPSIESFESNKNQFQNVFLADENKNMICVNFWGGLKKFGYEKVLDTGQIVACVNLQERVGNTRKSIPQYRVTEFTYFTKAPRNVKAREIVEDLDRKLHLDRKKFCENCVNLKNNVTRLQCNKNITPYRMDNVNLYKNRMFIDTPAGVKTNFIDDFDLSGLDFESTFKQNDTQELSPKVLLRKQQVKEKINRLKMYGEPPPLNSIHIINKSEIKSYKNPLGCIGNGVATLKNIPDNLQSTVSPVTSVNRTHVKSAFNPVKINFDNVHDNTNGVDHFAEEFDGSPPLSLE